MGWLITCDQARATVVAKAKMRGRLLGRGALVFELEINPGDVRARKIINYTRSHEWERSFILYMNPDASISVEHRQGSLVSYARVSAPSNAIKRLRVTYQWAGPDRLGVLAAECLETGTFNQAVFANPLPVPYDDAKRICTQTRKAMHDNALRSSCLSEYWQRIGPKPTIAGGTMVDTPEGPRGIEKLRLGDLVTTRNHGDKPIRWIVEASRPNVGFDAPVELRAPFIGLDQNLTVAGRQMVEVPIGNFEYVVGQEFAMVEASDFGDQVARPVADHQIERPYFQLLLDVHDCIRLNGIWSESMYVGRLKQMPDALITTHLIDMGVTALPIHHNSTVTKLSGHETLSLLDEMIA